MLLELNIENLAVIPSARLELAPGLNVISGETGAGKTILAQAIALLLGTRAGAGLIRPGAAAASVEAVFAVPPGTFGDLADAIDIPEDEYLTVRRRLGQDGRSRAWLGGHGVSLSVLGRVTGRLLKFSAQHEQQRLMMASHQLDILDDFSGAQLIALRAEYSLLYQRRGELKTRLAALDQGTESRQREAELLRFQLQEIEAAGLLPGEDSELSKQRQRLQHARELQEAASELAASLGAMEAPGETGGAAGSLMDRLAQSAARLESDAGLDGALDLITGRLKNAYYELEETGRAARDYAEAVQSDPESLAEVEERLELISQLRRKYGDTVAEVLRYAAKAAERLQSLDGGEEDQSQVSSELAAVEQEAWHLAQKLREFRQRAANDLEDQAGQQLKELAFQDCGFEARLAEEPELGPAGADAVEFFVQLNPGMPAAPLRQTASGGELSRIMLAVKAAAGAGEVATLVFDEIDAGIGGETGGAVGAKLASLAAHSQVICITHLPQIACFASAGQHPGAHFSVVKKAAGGETATAVRRLDGSDITDELCRMMGSRPDDAGAREHAQGLLAKASSLGKNSSGRGSANRKKQLKKTQASKVTQTAKQASK